MFLETSPEPARRTATWPERASGRRTRRDVFLVERRVPLMAQLPNDLAFSGAPTWAHEAVLTSQ
jgi:hypothetical protein